MFAFLGIYHLIVNPTVCHCHIYQQEHEFDVVFLEFMVLSRKEKLIIFIMIVYSTHVHVVILHDCGCWYLYFFIFNSLLHRDNVSTVYSADKINWPYCQSSQLQLVSFPHSLLPYKYLHPIICSPM
jgi:hypothetical protein